MRYNEKFKEVKFLFYFWLVILCRTDQLRPHSPQAQPYIPHLVQSNMSSNVSTSSVAGIVAGRNPLTYSASSPYTIFLFQAVFILVLCQIIHWPLKKLRQPRVIAEVVAGIILGPTVLGQIPGFSELCFPQASKSGLTLIANVGIILFLFVVGLEVDLKYIKKNMKVAVIVGLSNMAIPFAIGCGIAKALFDEYNENKNIEFTTFMVFIAIALCITAFPVLVRILIELNLISDQIGTIVLSAGIINDLTGWILLALVVTLANADDGIQTLYILLLALAWFLVLLYPVKWSFTLYLRRFTNDLSSGQPSPKLMILIILMVFISAFYTDIIGVHPIFGAFMVGVIIPRDNGYVVRITEKLEDLIYIVMIPIFFAVVGLSVDLTKLNRGIDWAFCIAIIALAMAGKVIGGLIGAKINGFCWRDSLTVGVLMSCKGIVEIVVLNVGLNANIISERVYSMFVVMALVTTFLTTPLTMWVYPQKYRKGISIWQDPKTPSQEHEELVSQKVYDLSLESLDNFGFSGILLLLKRIDNISNLMLLLRDLEKYRPGANICAVHLREFTSRTSHLLEASSAGDSTKNEQEYADSISILSIVKAFSSMLDINFTAKSLLSPISSFMVSVNDQVTGSANFLLTSASAKDLIQPAASSPESLSEFYSQVIRECKCHVGVLIPSNSKITEGSKEIRLVLNQDDRLSSSDLLSLHIVHRLGLIHHQIHVYIRSSSQRNKEFESQFDDYLESSHEETNLSISYFKDFTDIFTPKDTEFSGSMFVVTHEFMEENMEPIVRSGQNHEFDILVLNASKK